MNKKEFLAAEALCKKEWKELAETGNEYKSNKVRTVINRCPACQVSSTNGRWQNCLLCPIDRWRKITIKDAKAKKDVQSSYAACEKFGQPYNMWHKHTTSQEDRKKYAKTISRLKWTFLKEHRKK